MYQIVINDFSDAKKQNISFRNNAENTKPKCSVCCLKVSVIFRKSSCALVCILYVAESSVTITPVDAFGLNLYPEYIYICYCQER